MKWSCGTPVRVGDIWTRAIAGKGRWEVVAVYDRCIDYRCIINHAGNPASDPTRIYPHSEVPTHQRILVTPPKKKGFAAFVNRIEKGS